MPIQVAYQFVGEEMYNGQPVFRIKAKYATRINKYLKTRRDDPDLESATGTHDIDLLVNRDTVLLCGSGAVPPFLERYPHRLTGPPLSGPPHRMVSPHPLMKRS
jgi:hypothetical protein